MQTHCTRLLSKSMEKNTDKWKKFIQIISIYFLISNTRLKINIRRSFSMHHEIMEKIIQKEYYLQLLITHQKRFERNIKRCTVLLKKAWLVESAPRIILNIKWNYENNIFLLNSGVYRILGSNELFNSCCCKLSYRHCYTPVSYSYNVRYFQNIKFRTGVNTF